jgi:hypothetical protein
MRSLRLLSLVISVVSLRLLRERFSAAQQKQAPNPQIVDVLEML